LLSDSRVDPSDNNNEAIKYASENGHSEVVELLLSNSRVDPSDVNNEAIRLTSGNGYLKVVKLLLSDSRTLSNYLVINGIAIDEKCWDILTRFHKNLSYKNFEFHENMNKSNWPRFLL